MLGEEFYRLIATHRPFSTVHPRVGQFLKDYLHGEKAERFGERFVINTQFPPYPSRAFDRLGETFLGPVNQRRLYSATVAVTNRCSFNCWHCYNAGRDTREMPLETIVALAGQLQDRGAALVTITGGEPLLRHDLESICQAFDDRSCVNVGTTGWGLSIDRARRLRDGGVFAVGVSLDSADEAEHDAMRRRRGAYRAALDALDAAARAGLYPYIVSLGTREFLERNRFMAFMAFAGRSGAREVHLLEPCPAGNLAGREDVVLTAAERRMIVAYQWEIAAREDLPILSTFAYLEGENAFGCGAGLSHIYIDGSGELCPCNLVPLSFGNVQHEALGVILDRMGEHFHEPRSHCVGHTLAKHIAAPFPAEPTRSSEICRQHLPGDHEVPLFVRVRREATELAGTAELANAYDSVHGDYDDFWVVEAGKAVVELAGRLSLRGDERVFEAGCGSGFGTAILAARLNRGGLIMAADISKGMLSAARQRLTEAGATNVELCHGDAIELLRAQRGLDGIFTTWVLGYIPLAAFFAAASAALRPGGWLALVVHREQSPRRESELFAELVAEDPSVLGKQVTFDFPRDREHLAAAVRQAGLTVQEAWDGAAIFMYRSADEVLEHLLKSGAGTVFYDAIDPTRRNALTEQFCHRLAARNVTPGRYEVRHDYVACIARAATISPASPAHPATRQPCG